MHSELQAHRSAAISRLRLEFQGVVAEETIAVTIDECFERRADSRVTMYVPMLAEREARERLRAAVRHSA